MYLLGGKVSQHIKTGDGNVSPSFYDNSYWPEDRHCKQICLTGGGIRIGLVIYELNTIHLSYYWIINSQSLEAYKK